MKEIVNTLAAVANIKYCTGQGVLKHNNALKAVPANSKMAGHRHSAARFQISASAR